MINLNLYKQSISENISYLTDKMIVDFVNGLDTAKELNHKAMMPNSFLRRNLSLISGRSQQSQANINDHMIAGLEACQNYFQEVMLSQQGHTHALVDIYQKLKSTQLQAAELTHYVLDFRQQIESTLYSIEGRLDKIESYHNADIQMKFVLSKLKAEKFSKLPLLSQCYVVLDTLYWGDFGLHLRTYHNQDTKRELLSTLENELIATFKQNLNIGAKTDLHINQWLELPNTKEETYALQEALSYQGDWSIDNYEYFPMTFMATQYNQLPSTKQASYKGLTLNMIDISRVTGRMIAEIDNRTERDRLQKVSL